VTLDNISIIINMSTNDHYSRTRTQSFPADLSVKKGGKGKIIREESESIDHFDADDEASSVSQFGSKVSSLPGDSSTSSLPRTPSLMGSIYSIGGAVWNYIRGNNQMKHLNVHFVELFSMCRAR
jgi:hypothetical protein